jgi:8-oxo-dGTP diphosphatase
MNKKSPIPSVKLILRYRKQILILKHTDGTFDFPGGTVEFGEKLIDALKRELKEELNYSLNQESKLFDVWNYISKDNKKHIIIIYYFLKTNKKPKLSSPEKLEILWLNKKEMKKIIDDYNLVERMFSCS